MVRKLVLAIGWEPRVAARIGFLEDDQVVIEDIRILARITTRQGAKRAARRHKAVILLTSANVRMLARVLLLAAPEPL